jgi:capsular exopolysaccharide synthesis family protein
MRVEEELKTYLQVIWRYKWIIAACGLIASVVALGISTQLTPLYSATATVRVASAPGGMSDYTYITSLTRLSNTYIEIATSDVSLDEVVKRLGLEEQPDVEVEAVPETELIRISASDPDPTQARDIANTLASLMIEQSMQLYGGNAPTAREILEEQLQQAKVDLDAALSEYNDALRAAQSSTTPSASGTPNPNIDVETLADLVSVRQQIYGDLLWRYEAARTSEQLGSNAITIVEFASTPLKPTSPRILLNTALGLFAGFATGMILAFLFEGMDNTVRGIEDVRAMTELPILCMIPELKRMVGVNANLSFSQDRHISPVPAFDQLRTRLILLSAKSKFTKFLITSPEPGTGKSTVAANLAISLTQGGNRVVLVDMDFRRPHQHSYMDLPNEKGLSDYLSGEIELDATLQSTKYPNLRVITTGSSPHISSDWLTPDFIDSFFNPLGKEFDYVLIDAPALLSVADPILLASQADAVILVVARRKTERPNLDFALQQLSELNANVMGIVVNKMPNSQLYSYYSERHEKKRPFWQGKVAKLISIISRRKDSNFDEK